MVKVAWFGSIRDAVGYDEVCRNIVPALARLGVDIYLRPGAWGKQVIVTTPWKKYIRDPPDDAIWVLETIPVGFKHLGKYTIGYTMFEADRLPPKWMPYFDNVDEVWVPSTFCKQNFERSGVKRPIYVMSLGVNTRRFNPRVKPLRVLNKKTFCFMTVISGSPDRKGLDVLVKAYTNEFHADEDVCLIIKFTEHASSFRGWILPIINSSVMKDSDVPKILYIRDVIPPRDMPRLYRVADCYVSPSRAEGFNLPVIEAMASGVPVIVTAWGGHLDYLTGKNSFLIGVKRLAPARARNVWYDYKIMKWAEPDARHLRELMRYVYENPDIAMEKATRALRDVRSEWTWGHAARRIYDRLTKCIE